MTDARDERWTRRTTTDASKECPWRRRLQLSGISGLFALILTGCASTPCPPPPIPEPIIEVVRVEVPVRVPCSLELEAPVPPPAGDDSIQWLSDWISTLEAWVDTVVELTK